MLHSIQDGSSGCVQRHHSQCSVWAGRGEIVTAPKEPHPSSSERSLEDPLTDP